MIMHNPTGGARARRRPAARIAPALAAAAASVLALTGIPATAQAADDTAAADAAVHSGAYALRADLQGNSATGWAYLTQQLTGLSAGTAYTFGAWVIGDGAVTIKVSQGSSGASALKFVRPIAEGDWQYATFDFTPAASGTYAFSIYDSAAATGSGIGVDQASGTMYIDDAFAGTPGGANLLANPGFESGGLSGWTAGSNTAPVVFSVAADTSSPPPVDNPGVDNLGAYDWDRNPGGVTDFGSWIGRSPYLAEDFLERGAWSDLEGGNRIAAWQGSPFAEKLLLATYPFPDGQGSLAGAADGDYNAHYLALGQNLVAAGEDDTVIRFGHEFNGDWYPWSIGNANDPDHAAKAADFAEAFRQFVTTMRSVPGQHFRFVWNPSASVWGVDLPAAYPGSDYVDYIGADFYDQTWATDAAGDGLYGADYAAADPATRLARQKLAWTAEVNDSNWGLNMIASFAAQQDVPFVLPEWGLAIRSDGAGGGDNPYFIDQMHAWIASHDVAWHVYFNVQAPDGNHNLFDTVAFPLGSAEFQKMWNPAGAPQTQPALEPPDIPGVDPAAEKVEAESGTLAGPAKRYLGDPWASGGELAAMYQAGNSLTLTDMDAAPGGLAIVYQGWESDEKASVYVNGVLAHAGILFPGHGRSWSQAYGYVLLPDVVVPQGATVTIRIDAADVVDNPDSLKLDYLLLLDSADAANSGGGHAYGHAENPGETNDGHTHG
jgi:hypothetical protein